MQVHVFKSTGINLVNVAGSHQSSKKTYDEPHVIQVAWER